MRIQTIDFSVNLAQALLWQYNEATHLQSLVEQKQAWYDLNQSEFWSNWYNDVFNLVTANEFGIAVWSIILDVPIYLNSSTDPDGKPIYGFTTIANDYQNFENGNFSNVGTVIKLSVEEQRLLLRLRYYQLVSRGAIPEINAFLTELFKTSGTVFAGNAWVLDAFDMSIIYVFNFYLPKVMRQVIVELDLLPRPAAVGIRYRVLTGTIFGFESFNQNFENGNFLPDYF